MKNLFTILLILFATILYGQESIQLPLSDGANQGTLIVRINRGPITVKGMQRSDVKITYSYLEDNEPAVEVLDNGLKRISGGQPDLTIYENHNEVQITSDDWNKGVKLDIEVPVSFSLDLHSYNDGDIQLSSVNGEHNIETFNGGIIGDDLQGSISAHTFNGEIRVVLKKVHQGTPMAFSNYTGGIDVTLPADTAAKLKMQSKNGEIFTGFDVNLTTEGASENAKSKGHKIEIGKNNWLVAKINGGGPEITFQNHYHDIYIRKSEK